MYGYPKTGTPAGRAVHWLLEAALVAVALVSVFATMLVNAAFR